MEYNEDDQITRKDNQCQTDDIKMIEVSTQQPCCTSLSTQTLHDIYGKPISSINNQSKQPTIDFTRLSRFLQRSTALIQHEIRESCQFEQLSSSWLNYWNGASGKGIHCERRLTSKILDSLLSGTKSGSGDHQYISGITWNAPQTTLAVVYKAKIHSGWCTHKTFLLLWNLYSHKGDYAKPLYCCEVDNCVTCLIAHPYRGSFYILGCYNGSLLVIDTRLLDTATDLSDLPVFASSPHRGDLHQDSIIGMHWLKLDNKRQWLENEDSYLVSFSSEGLIIRWKLESKSKLLIALDLYNIILTDLPKSMGLRDTLGSHFKGVPITSFTWESESDSGFIIGCEAGGIFRCSLNGELREEAPDDPLRPTDWLPLKNPIVMAYVPHRAIVTNVDFSPNLRNIFISTGKDNELRVWDVFQSKPLFVVHCDVNIVSTIWLFARPVIFTIQEDGFICIYSITNKAKPKSIHRFSLEERKPAQYIWSNYLARDDQLAISDQDNAIHLYSVNLNSETIRDNENN
ncbi:WD repeat-containing protein 34-like [Tetranychus urticae]|uniref:WD repeat-containing protein 34-like n=1 Tax=Tetranychus urticae TaxID=32264 RepID=UPI00077BBD43|nr:WD repeat-containing protein 34-like [Tetranychus urticae]